MPLKPFLIAPFNTGLQNDIKPWLIPEDAFSTLVNAYIWRGRLKKRLGTLYIGDGGELFSRLRIGLGMTDAVTGNFSGTVPGIIFGIGQMFSIGTVVFTVNATGTPANMLSTGTATGTYNTTTGDVVITGNTENPSTTIYFYPAQPVMGLKIRENLSTGKQETIAFDTQFAYSRILGGWDQLGTAVWTGTDFNFFYTLNYRGASNFDTYFYVVNYTSADNIKFIPEGSSTWTNLNPQLDVGATRFLQTARIIVGFKDRIVVLNTIESESSNDKSYQTRCRWSQNGDPTDATTGWLDDTPGKGGYNDCPTDETIVAAEFIKDRLIVFLSSSTWELVYTGDATLPFRWQQLDVVLGAESTFSSIPLDTNCLTVGNVGIHACDGVNVKRIDDKIPDEVFNINNGSDGVQRVYGIRDFYTELVYWTYPDETTDPTYPTRILVYNYKNGAWAFFEDSLTCFGYYQTEQYLSWAVLGTVYGSWANWHDPWGGAESQIDFPEIACGNQQGFVFILDREQSSNEQSLYITDINATTGIFTVINHNLPAGEYIYIEECNGITSANNTVFQVDLIDADTFTLVPAITLTGTYTGGGKITRISNLNIYSKQWNPGTPVGLTFILPYMDLLLTATVSGQVSIDYLINSTATWSINDQIPVPTDLADEVNYPLLGGVGSNVVYTKPEDNVPYQPDQVRIWHRYYIIGVMDTLQINIFLSDAQMKDVTISQDSNFELNAIVLYVDTAGRIIS